MAAVAQFEYLERLGEGIAGVVYRARDAKGREVAVKLLRESAAKDQELLRRFRREVDLATALDHENLVLAYEGGQTPAGRLYLASEFVRGTSAARLIEHVSPLPEAAALSIARDVLRALGYLHARGLIHRDVKPANILIRTDGLAKLSDFGLARSAVPGGARVTSTGEVLGTPYYLAPEQIQARKDVDIRADLYSLGCVLYELLAGKRPFDGASVVEILAAQIRRMPAELGTVRSGLRPATIELVARLLSKERAERLQDPAEAERRCTEILEALGAGDGRQAVREAIALIPASVATPARPAAPAVTLTSADAVAAQGGRSPRLKLKLAASRGTLTLFVFSGDRLQLGRDSIDRSHNDVCLRVRGLGGEVGSRKIAGAHFRVELDAKGAFLKDLETVNGTRLNGIRLAPRVATRVRSRGAIDVAGALALEMEVFPAEKEGEPPTAVLLTRSQNSTDQAYLLVRDKILIDAAAGEPRVGAPAGSILAFRGGALLLDDQPLVAGTTLRASGLTIEVDEIRPEDMK